jgi:large subunit ribosomal protein L3
MRAILGKKIGMTQIFDENGKVVPVTVVSVEGSRVVKHITTINGKTLLELGAGQVKKANKADQGNYTEAGFVPAFTFRIEGDAEANAVGTTIEATQFEIGERVDVVSTSKGKGFQGVVKRHGFSGGPKTHGGKSGKYRSPGSIGSGTTLGRIFKGTKMGGRMGNVRTTIKNLKVVQIDGAENIIAVRGSIPGPKGQYLVIRSRK